MMMMITATMMDDDDGWTTAAMNDDSMVAELLLRIKSSNASEPERSVPAMKLLPGWGIRRPRSAMRNNDVDLVKKDEDEMRSSPVTPFSWSEEGTTGGGGSQTTTADGCETSSRSNNNSSPTARSKGAVTNEAASGIKLGKIKTFAELKQENIPLMERLYLNKELTTLHATFNDQTSRNESSKRLKVEHNLQDTRRTWAVSHEHKSSHSNYTHQTPLALPEPDYYDFKASLSNYTHQIPFVLPKPDPSYEHRHLHSNYTHLTPLVLPKHAPSDTFPRPDSLKVQNSNMVQERSFLLPDLNMTPSLEEDSSSDT